MAAEMGIAPAATVISGPPSVVAAPVTTRAMQQQQPRRRRMKTIPEHDAPNKSSAPHRQSKASMWAIGVSIAVLFAIILFVVLWVYDMSKKAALMKSRQNNTPTITDVQQIADATVRQRLQQLVQQASEAQPAQLAQPVQQHPLATTTPTQPVDDIFGDAPPTAPAPAPAPAPAKAQQAQEAQQPQPPSNSPHQQSVSIHTAAPAAPATLMVPDEALPTIQEDAANTPDALA